MTGARVQSLEALAIAKVALVDLKDRLASALSEATSDLERFARWLEQEQPALLTSLLRRQEEDVTMARSALFRKQMVVSAKDSKPSIVDEKKALERAIARVEDTRKRLGAVKRWNIEFQREFLLYKGACAGMQGAVDHDLPLAIATVMRMAQALERYVAERAPDLSRLMPDLAEDGSGAGAPDATGTGMPVRRDGEVPPMSRDGADAAAPPCEPPPIEEQP